MYIPGIETLESIKGKRVIVRAPLNVPVENGCVTNAFRLERFLPTLTYLLEECARVVVIGHIGRGGNESLEPVHAYFNVRVPITFFADGVGSGAVEASKQLCSGEALLVENLRKHSGEVGNSQAFAKELAALGDIYINDAFSASHREHASIIGVPQLLPSYAGFNFVDEVQQLSNAFTPKTPSLFILGGAKFETKQPLIEKFLDIYDHVFVGGALANDIFKARGYEVGVSMVAEQAPDLSRILNNPKLLVPIDVVVRGNEGVRTTTPDDVAPDESILDAGPATIAALERYIKKAQFVLWNGPLGNYEEGFKQYTEALVRILGKHDVDSIVGGGDTIASVSAMGALEQFSFVSTGGGAMLQFLSDNTLPGIEALIK